MGSEDVYKRQAKARASPGKTQWEIKFTCNNRLWVIKTVPIAGHKIPEKIVTIKGINHQLFIKDIIRIIRYDQKYRTLINLENDGN